jgi:hypothetical protein
VKVTLELETHRHLTGAVASVLVGRCCRDGSESTRIAEVKVRVSEVGVVEHVGEGILGLPPSAQTSC